MKTTTLVKTIFAGAAIALTGACQSYAQTAPAPNDEATLAATFRNIADLRADLSALNYTAKASAEQKALLLVHLTTAAQGKKPSTNAVQTLAQDLLPAVLGKTTMSDHLNKLARNLHALCNGATVTTVQETILLDDVRKILLDAGAANDDVAKVVADLKSLVKATR